MMTESFHRFVDRDNQGWHPVGGHFGGPVYAADYGFQRDLPDRPYDALAETRGPLRPVRPVTDADVAELERLFASARRKTVTTLAAALASVYRRAGTELGTAQNRARRALIAGREGSWESEVLISVMWFGGELLAGGPRKRIDPAALDGMTAVLWRWVASPDRYTEVAETLASIVSGYCDRNDGGWRAVADQWLQPGGLAQADFSACYRLFYSLSEHFDSGVI